MGLGADAAEAFIGTLFPHIKSKFTNGANLEVMGCVMFPELLPNDADLGTDFCEACLGTYEKPNPQTRVKEPRGRVCCNANLLALANVNTIKFGLAHELGHAFSEPLLKKIGMPGLDGPRTEVIADLGAAYLLTLAGVSWEDVIAGAEGWNIPANKGIFTVGWSGDHPPGAARIKYVKALKAKMTATPPATFDAAAKEIMTKLKDYKKNASTHPEA
jgi:hypothetical protein